MDLSAADVIKFWGLLCDNQVSYILAGDFAMCFHGHNIGTGVMSIWIENTIQNRRKLIKALTEYGIDNLEVMEQMEFIPDWIDFKLNNGLQLDIMVNMKGLDGFSFEECLLLASIADFEGVQVPFLHINHLIANKKGVNRLKDQLDVAELEKIKDLQKKQDSDTKL